MTKRPNFGKGLQNLSIPLWLFLQGRPPRIGGFNQPPTKKDKQVTGGKDFPEKWPRFQRSNCDPSLESDCCSIYIHPFLSGYRLFHVVVSQGRCQKVFAEFVRTEGTPPVTVPQKVQSRREREIWNWSLQFWVEKEKSKIPFPSFEKRKINLKFIPTNKSVPPNFR